MQGLSLPFSKITINVGEQQHEGQTDISLVPTRGRPYNPPSSHVWDPLCHPPAGEIPPPWVVATGRTPPPTGGGSLPSHGWV
ncbi:hypothetical protein FH972_009413 [Carpinus fangiana]|uniref:Uncharacterized protein n=1 Tax=Carpinus fangiana TaxID=176857 RepID=A0A5N6R4S0_9ROSI|nr:hypothetical protein FH972_009413 [Carpinus fangiana]